MNRHEVPFYSGSLANNTTKVLRFGSIISGKNPICQHTTNLSEFIAQQVPCRSGLFLQRPAASSVATESSSAQFIFQAMVISLGGSTLMIDATPDAPVLLLVEDVARLLGLPDTCFYLALVSRVLRDYMSRIRVCARMRGECNRPMAVLVAAVLAVAATLGNGPAPTRSAGPIGVGQLKRSASGVDPRRGMGSLKSRVGLLTLLRGGRHVNNIIWGDQLGRHLVSVPPCPKRQPRLHERRRLRRPHLAFPHLSFLPRCRRLNFLKGTWMVSSFWSFKIGWLSRSGSPSEGGCSAP